LNPIQVDVVGFFKEYLEVVLGAVGGGVELELIEVQANLLAEGRQVDGPDAVDGRRVAARPRRRRQRGGAGDDAAARRRTVADVEATAVDRLLRSQQRVGGEAHRRRRLRTGDHRRRAARRRVAAELQPPTALPAAADRRTCRCTPPFGFDKVSLGFGPAFHGFYWVAWHFCFVYCN